MDATVYSLCHMDSPLLTGVEWWFLQGATWPLLEQKFRRERLVEPTYSPIIAVLLMIVTGTSCLPFPPPF